MTHNTSDRLTITDIAIREGLGYQLARDRVLKGCSARSRGSMDGCTSSRRAAISWTEHTHRTTDARVLPRAIAQRRRSTSQGSTS